MPSPCYKCKLEGILSTAKIPQYLGCGHTLLFSVEQKKKKKLLGNIVKIEKTCLLEKTFQKIHYLLNDIIHETYMYAVKSTTTT